MWKSSKKIIRFLEGYKCRKCRVMNASKMFNEKVKGEQNVQVCGVAGDAPMPLARNNEHHNNQGWRKFTEIRGRTVAMNQPKSEVTRAADKRDARACTNL